MQCQGFTPCQLQEVTAEADASSVCAGVLVRPPQPTMANARKEAEMVLFDSVRDVLRATNVHPRNVRTL